MVVGGEFSFIVSGLVLVGGWEGDRQVKGESKNKNNVGSKTKRDHQKNNQIKEGVF